MDAYRELILGCLEKDPKAQEALYRYYAPTMYGVCLRFARNQMEAEDILQEGFIKVYTYLGSYRFEGSFEGWVRKTFINTAINFYKRKSKELVDLNIDKIEIAHAVSEDIIDTLAANELLDLIQNLPQGYRMVFNLNVIEGYSHKEIGDMLSISENTSKSQLSRAKAVLKNKINQQKPN